MLTFNSKKKEGIFQIIVACLLGFLIGYSIVLSKIIPILPPYWFAALMGGFLLLLITAKKPELITLTFIILTSTIINESKIPYVDVGLSLFLYDVFFFLLMITTIILITIDPEKRLEPSPLNVPILLFVGIGFVATSLGYQRNVGEPLLTNFFFFLQYPPEFVQNAIPILRTVSFYLTFIAINNLFTSKKQVRFLVKAFYLFAFLSACVAILYEITGYQFPLSSVRDYALVTGGKVYQGVARIYGFTGEGIMVVALITKVTEIFVNIEKRIHWWNWVQVFTYALGVLLVFHRNYYIASGLAFVILIFLAAGETFRRRLFSWTIALLICLVILMMVTIIFPDQRISKISMSVFDRMTSLLRTETYQEGEGQTFRQRDVEYEYAVPKIIEHPIFGLGYGAYYRPYFGDEIIYLGENPTTYKVLYMHNGHMWIMTKSGLLGYAAFLSLSIIFIVRGFKNWRNISDPFLQGIYLGFTLVYLGLQIAAIVEPIFMTFFWVPLITMMWGINEVILRLEKKQLLEQG